MLTVNGIYLQNALSMMRGIWLLPFVIKGILRYYFNIEATTNTKRRLDEEAY